MARSRRARFWAPTFSVSVRQLASNGGGMEDRFELSNRLLPPLAVSRTVFGQLFDFRRIKS